MLHVPCLFSPLASYVPPVEAGLGGESLGSVRLILLRLSLIDLVNFWTAFGIE